MNIYLKWGLGLIVSSFSTYAEISSRVFKPLLLLVFHWPTMSLNPTPSRYILISTICRSTCPCTLYCIQCYSYLFSTMPSYLPLFHVCPFSLFLTNLHICHFQISSCFFASIFWCLCVSVSLSTKHSHLYKHTPLPPYFPLSLQSMPISSACLVFDGACPPHRPP